MKNNYLFLVKAITTVFGSNVHDVSSAKKLSKEIEIATNSSVSYNSIRRIFGLIKTEQTSYHLKTLNTLSRYSGFENFAVHEKHSKNYKRWKLINSICYANYKIEKFKELKLALQSELKRNPEAIMLLGLLTNKLLHQKKEKQLIDLYSIELKNIYSPSMLMSVTNCCNLMATSLRQHSFRDSNTLKALAQQKKFIQLYVHHFIDYSKENHNYVALLKNTTDENYTETDTAYKYLFLDTMNFFQGKKLNFKGLDIPYTKINNDFVRGRWIAISYLKNNRNFNLQEFKNPKKIVLGTEILVFALIQNDFTTIEKICTFYESEDLNSINWYYKNEKIIIDLFLSFQLFSKGNEKEANALFKTIKYIEDSNFQCVEHNTTLYLYFQAILEGPSIALNAKFNAAKKNTHLELLRSAQAIALHHYFRGERESKYA